VDVNYMSRSSFRGERSSSRTTELTSAGFARYQIAETHASKAACFTALSEGSVAIKIIQRSLALDLTRRVIAGKIGEIRFPIRSIRRDPTGRL